MTDMRGMRALLAMNLMGAVRANGCEFVRIDELLEHSSR